MFSVLGLSERRFLCGQLKSFLVANVGHSLSCSFEKTCPVLTTSRKYLAVFNDFFCNYLGFYLLGCPYAKGASGNVATEDVLYMLEGGSIFILTRKYTVSVFVRVRVILRMVRYRLMALYAFSSYRGPLNFQRMESRIRIRIRF